MPDLAEPPAQTLAVIAQTYRRPVPAGLIPFNSQTASQAARRRHELERLRANALPPSPTASPALPLPVPPPALPDDRIAMLLEQIKLTRASLNDNEPYCKTCERGRLDAKDRAQLIRGLCGLLDQLRIAKGEPLPGSRKPAAEKAPRGPSAWESYTARPVVPEQVPLVVAPAPVDQVKPQAD